MMLSFEFAAENDIPALLRLRLAVEADQARRFGTDRWATTINEKGITRGLKTSRVLVARRPRANHWRAEDGHEETVGN